MILTVAVEPETLASETEAISGFSEVHLIVLKLAFVGVMPSLKVSVSPITILKLPSVRVDVGVRTVICTVSFTVTLQVALTEVPLPSVAVTVIVAVPGATPKTSPSSVTEATALLFVVQV